MSDAIGNEKVKLIGREKSFLEVYGAVNGVKCWSCFYLDAEKGRYEYDFVLKYDSPFRGQRSNLRCTGQEVSRQ